MVVKGNAYKSGNSQWTVLSDERLKTDISNFSLGTDEEDVLKRVIPRLFRYNKQKFGNDSTIDFDKLHVGLVAQEIPPELQQHCRHVVQINFKDGPKSMFVVEKDAIDYLVINVVNTHSSNIKVTCYKALSITFCV